MLDLQAILDAARRAAEAASCPAEVLLFGSYARGDAKTGSDLDLMVIEDQIDDKTAEYLKIHRAVGSMGVGVDIVVISREDFERRRQVPGTIPYWAAREGLRVHDARA
jgi:predicted nucleotidyltransferase